jgi:hypothetical protein
MTNIRYPLQNTFIWLPVFGVVGVLFGAGGKLLGMLAFKSIPETINEWEFTIFIIWIVFGSFIAVVVLPIENKFIWAKYRGKKLLHTPHKYELAPASLGFTIGFLSAWL